MKHLILAVLIIILATSSVLADGIEYAYNDNSVKVVAYKGNSKNVVIPDNVDGLPVEEIADGAFQNADVEEIKLPEKIMSIGKGAFEGCNNLNYINLPASINTICDNAFEGCNNLVAYVDEFSFAYGYCLEKNIALQYISVE